MFFLIIVVALMMLLIAVGVFMWRRQKTENYTVSSAEVRFYHSPNCPWCKKFYPVWDEFKVLAAKNNISANSFNCLEGECPDDVRGYPTVRIYKNGRMVEYEGDREAQKILEAVLKV